VFAVAAVDVMVTGGFDFAPARAPYDREQPSAYVRVADAAQYVSDRFRSISWNDPQLIDEASAATPEELAGANDGSEPVNTFSGPTGDELYQEIASLYADSEDGYREEAEYADAAAIDEPYAEDEYAETVIEEEFSPGEAEKLATASESESPW
jgi:hypothetical protein